VSSLDLLLAAVALHHSAVLLSFDDDFEVIAAVSELQLRRLQRPV
jgi:predicted nucleic acid-binding protein